MLAVDVWLGSKYVPDSIHVSWLFLRENNKNLLVFDNTKAIRYPSYQVKNETK